MPFPHPAQCLDASRPDSLESGCFLDTPLLQHRDTCRNAMPPLNLSDCHSAGLWQGTCGNAWVQQICLAVLVHVACQLLCPGHVDVQLVGGALVLCRKVRPLQAWPVSLLCHRLCQALKSQHSPTAAKCDIAPLLTHRIHPHAACLLAALMIVPAL